MKTHALAIAWLISISSVSVRAENPATGGETAKDFTEIVKKRTHELAASDPFDAEAAVVSLSTLPLAAFPTIEAAVKDPTLPPVGLAKLREFVNLQAPWQAARERNLKARLEHQHENIARALMTYEKAGSRNAKWDDAARDAIKKFTSAAPHKETRKALEQAIAAGCDDAFILYLEARTLEYIQPAESEAIQQLYDHAVAGMQKRPYPASRKLYCYIRSFWHLASVEYAKAGPGKPVAQEGHDKLTGLLNAIHDAWPHYMEENPPEPEFYDLAILVIDGINGNSQTRKKMFDAIYPQLEKLRPNNSTVLTIKGHFYIQYGWDARGGGWANTVTPEGWKLLAERMDIAEKALTQAWELDHNNSKAAIEMLTVELAQGQGRQRMEQWYRRAMEADPDSYAACKSKLYYLQPKWHGSVEDMLAFANECYDTHNWRGELQFIQIQVYEDILPYLKDPKAFFAQPQVWESIRRVYEPWLRHNPKNSVARSKYCYFAGRCGKWDVAKRQFEILGDAASSQQFGDEKTMEEMRRTALGTRLTPNVP